MICANLNCPNYDRAAETMSPPQFCCLGCSSKLTSLPTEDILTPEEQRLTVEAFKQQAWIEGGRHQPAGLLKFIPVDDAKRKAIKAEWDELLNGNKQAFLLDDSPLVEELSATIDRLSHAIYSLKEIKCQLTSYRSKILSNLASKVFKEKPASADMCPCPTPSSSNSTDTKISVPSTE